MELIKKGYQQTEIGVIPKDWKVKSISEVASIQRGKFTPRPRNNPIYYNGNIPFVQTGDITRAKGKINTFSQTLNEQGLAVSKLFNKGTILMTIAANIGYSGVLEIDMACPDSLMGIDGNYNMNNNFLNYYFMYKREDIENLSTSGAQKNLNIELFSPFKIPLPPLPEQKAIAEVLSDMDNLITALERQIEKKRLVKQGAMQRLLTAGEDWEVRTLGEVCWFQEGPGLRNWQFTRKGIKVINITNLVKGYLDLSKTYRHISYEEFQKMYKHFEIDEGDIVMASSGNSYSKVAVVRKEDLRLLMNTSVIRFKPLEGLNYYYLLIFLRSNFFKNQIDLLITGGAQPNFGPFHLNKVKILLPPTLEEQTRIATILSDMDGAIAGLEKQLEKYRAVKVGLMQELLSGRKRLIDN
jgi:type I restriction enzyme S subunit